MAVAVIMLEKKLRRYLDELGKVTEQAIVKLNHEVTDPNDVRDTSLRLKESSMVLNKMISWVREIQAEIQLLPEQILDKAGELLNVVDLSLTAELEAETILCKIDAKLIDFDEVKNRYDANVLPKNSSSVLEEVENGASLPLRISKSDEKVASNDKPTSSNCSSLPKEIVACDHKVVPNDVLDGQSNPNEENSSTINVGDSSTLTAESEAQVRKEFDLRRCTGEPEYNMARFLKDFRVTVDESPLNEQHKFAALRGLVRGYPYRFFLDLDYRNESHYRRALNRLIDEYADDELKRKANEKVVARPWVPPIVEDVPHPDPKNTFLPCRWSDEYFTNKYCKTAPNYEKPSRELLVRAMHAFLNLYVFGPNKVPKMKWQFVWLILLHGVKFKDRYMLDRSDSTTFGNKKVPFPEIEESSKMSVVKYAPCLIQERETQKLKPKIWEWKYTMMEDGCPVEEVVTSLTVRNWYQNCWDAVEKADEKALQDYVKYFTLLSMILFRVTLKKAEKIEKYVSLVFNKSFRSFCHTVFMPNGVPPHILVYSLIRKQIFKKYGSNFRRYLTYLVGSYAFSDSDMRYETRQFLNAGCLMQFSSAGIGSIYWLRKAAKGRKMKPLDLLMFFLIDSSMETEVKKLHQFIETYRKEVTWWWGRFFEKNKLREVSSVSNPAFAYACFVLNAASEAEISESKTYEQFWRIKDQPANLSGENLGRALKYIIDEWNTTPLSQITKILHKKIEKEKCFLKKNKKKEKRTHGPPE